jgi:hypothetical protein
MAGREGFEPSIGNTGFGSPEVRVVEIRQGLLKELITGVRLDARRNGVGNSEANVVRAITRPNRAPIASKLGLLGSGACGARRRGGLRVIHDTRS